MAFAEVKATLGLDISPFEAGLAKGGKALREFSGKATKDFGAKDAGRALATAIGLNLQSIGESAARIFTGVSKEAEAAFARMVELSDKTTEKILTSLKLRRTDEQQLTLLKEKQVGLEEQLAAANEKQGQSPSEDNFNAAEAAKDALQSNLDEQASIEKKANEDKKKAQDELEKSQKDLVALQKENANIGESDVEQKKRLKEEAWEILELAKINGLKGKELADAQVAAQKKENEAKQIGLKIDEDAKKNAQNRLDLTKKRTAAEKEVAGAQSDLDTAKKDAGLNTVEELAKLDKFDPRTDTRVAGFISDAQNVTSLESKAEEARKFGRSDEFATLKAQAQGLRGSLAAAGAVKSTEAADPFAALAAKVDESNLKLQGINDKLAGKFANQ